MVSRTATRLRKERMETPLPTLIEMFLADKRTEGKSPATVAWYQDKLGRFASYCGELKLNELSVEQAKAFIQSLQQKQSLFADHPYRPEANHGLSTHTIHGYVRSLKVFSSWLRDEEFTQVDIFERLKRPRVSQPVIEVLTESEVSRIFDSINPNCLMGARLYLIVLLLYDTGMRASELCNINQEDVYLEDDQIKVLGKGNKERYVPFSAKTKKALIRYMNTWRPEPAEKTDRLILTDDGYPLSNGALLQIIKRLAKRCGIPRLHPHLFRHSFSVSYLVNGGDLQSLRLILGHTDISVTQMYLRLTNVQVKAQHAKFSPVDRLNIKRRKP